MWRTLLLLLMLLGSALAASEDGLVQKACERQGLKVGREDYTTFGTFNLQNLCPDSWVAEAEAVLIVRNGRGTEGKVKTPDNESVYHRVVKPKGNNLRVHYRFTPLTFPPTPDGPDPVEGAINNLNGSVGMAGCEYMASTCLTVAGLTLAGGAGTVGVAATLAGAVLASPVGVIMAVGIVMAAAGLLLAGLLGAPAMGELAKVLGAPLTIDNPDGSTTTYEPDGDKVTVRPDGSSTHEFANGTVLEQNADGTQVRTTSDGVKETVYPDGTIVYEYPDGTVDVIPGSGSGSGGGSSDPGGSGGTGGGSGSGDPSGSGGSGSGSGDPGSGSGSGGESGGSEPTNPGEPEPSPWEP